MFAKAFPEMRVSGMRGTIGQNGITPSIYASWLQKSIRRGIFDQAIYAAAGLFAFSTEERGAPLLTFLLNRLEIIAIEDIGLANPFLVDTIISTFEKVRKTPEFNSIAGVVKSLCESPKTRLCSWIKNALGREKAECDIEPFGTIKYLFHMEPSEIKKQKIGRDTSPLSKWIYQSGKSSKSEWIFGLVLILIREKSEIPNIEPFDSDYLFEKWVTEPEVLEGEMKDIVLDIHTGKKKKTTETKYDFALRGAYIENEKVMYPHLKEFYNECKRTGNDGWYPFKIKKQHFCRDKDIFQPNSKLIGFKTPTLFGTLFTGEEFFIKLMYPGTGDFAVQCNRFRKKLGLFTKKTVIIKKVLMTFDYISLSLDSSKTASARTIGALKTKCSDIVDVLLVSKVENSMNLCQTIKSGLPINMLELMKVLLFRRYIESTDTNSNNIQVDSDGRCLSVDENPAGDVQYKRWAKLGDTVFTAQKNANFPDIFVTKLKKFSEDNESELVEFLRTMKNTKFDINRNEEWIDRMIINKNWF